jgi:glycosyltransferase involved in cell wall biosynthesis
MRVLVYEDSVYSTDGTATFTDRAFLLFASRLGDRVDELVMLGRLRPQRAASFYRIDNRVRFVPLPYYESAAGWRALAAALRSLPAAWAAVGSVDVVWVMGPHPLAVLLTVVAMLRHKRVVLGVRQDLPDYARRRHPGRRLVHLAADVLEWSWRRTARRTGVVAVGAQLATHYRRAARMLELEVSLVPAAEVSVDVARDYAGTLRVLSVGRLDPEKNPLLLADVLAALRVDDPRWELVVCGDGPLREALEERLVALGVSAHARILGYVPVDAGLGPLYRSSHVLLHVSWTEGVPQVLLEAWGHRLPVVATAVGGVPRAAAGAALLVPPGDAAVAASALRTLVADATLRRRLVEEGTRRVSGRSMESTLDRLAAFLTAA